MNSPKDNNKRLHPNSLHHDRYPLAELVKLSSSLERFVAINKYGDLSVDFSNSEAVMALNTALMVYFYKVRDWSVPTGSLCPPVPGRADYIHYLAEILTEDFDSAVNGLRGIDIGTGTGCIYPILGQRIHNWKFVATDISSKAIDSCNQILAKNHGLFKDTIECRLQPDATSYFKGMIKSGEKFDFSMCNPPFHASLAEAKRTNQRKVRNLNINKYNKGHTDKIPSTRSSNIKSNFGGEKAELWCPGGELEFTSSMIKESREFKAQCKWFTTLVSRSEHLEVFERELNNISAKRVRITRMSQGQKVSHLLAWTFS